MLFVIIGHDASDSKDKRPIVRQAHLDYWSTMDHAGKVIIAGPLENFAGSLFIVESDDRREVENLAANDPYTLEGVFHSYDIHGFTGVLPSKVYGKK